MKELKEMILESNNTSRAYTTWFKNSGDAINFIKNHGNLKTQSVPEELINYLYTAVGNVTNANAPVIFNDAGEIKFRKSNLRIGIIGIGEINNLLDHNNRFVKDNITFTITGDRTCTVEVGGVSTKFAYGAGSAKGINIAKITRMQETYSCEYINAKLAGKEPEALPNGLESWASTFPAQFEVLKNNITELKKSHRFFRVGDTSEKSGWIGAKELEKVRTKFKQVAKFNQINALDPSDIYCVDLQNVNIINKFFNDVLTELNEKNYNDYLNRFKELFQSKILFGVSLKKVGRKGYNFQINNMEESNPNKIELLISEMTPDKLISSNKSLIIQTIKNKYYLVFRTKHGEKDSCILELKSNIILGSVSRQLYMDELNKYNFTSGYFKNKNFLNEYATYWKSNTFIKRFTKLYNNLFKNWKIHGIKREDVLKPVEVDEWESKFKRSKELDKSEGKIYSFIQQIFFLNAINNAYKVKEGDQLINKFMLLAEKIGDKNLPCILLEPQ